MTGSEVNNNEASESWSKLSEKNGKLSSKVNLKGLKFNFK